MRGELGFQFRELAAQSNPLTDQLFGDDLKKEMKEAEFGAKIMSKNYQGE